MNGRAGDFRHTAITPMTWSRASSGAVISRSSTSLAVPGMGTTRASPQTSLAISARRRAAASPMIPSPSLIVSARMASARLAQRDDRPERQALVVREVDGARVDADQRQRPLGHPLQHGPRVERGRDLAGHVDERGHLVEPAAGVPEQLGVLDGDADVRGDRLQQAGIRRPEPSLLLHALDADHADGAIAHQDRDAEIRLDGRADHVDAVRLEVLATIEEQRLPAAQDPRGQALSELHARFGAADAAFACSRRTRCGPSRRRASPRTRGRPRTCRASGRRPARTSGRGRAGSPAPGRSR